MNTMRSEAGLLGTPGNGWDVGWAAAFLASDEARWITGVTLPVESGVLSVTPLMMAPHLRAVPDPASDRFPGSPFPRGAVRPGRARGRSVSSRASSGMTRLPSSEVRQRFRREVRPGAAAWRLAGPADARRRHHQARERDHRDHQAR